MVDGCGPTLMFYASYPVSVHDTTDPALTRVTHASISQAGPSFIQCSGVQEGT